MFDFIINLYLLKLQISFLLFGQTMLLISLRKEKVTSSM